MAKRSQCLQDGIYISKFLILHPQDTDTSLPYQRYWIEYNKCEGGRKYLFNCPISVTKRLRIEESVPYREWIDYSDEKVLIHGPFNFSTLNK